VTINAAWHAGHVMPRNPTAAERIAWHRAHQAHCACRPIPARLLEQMGRPPGPATANGGSLRAMLTGGDRRSIAGSRRAHALVLKAPARVAELAALAEEREWLVAMRAMDLLEKLAHQHPDWVQPHRRLFIGPLADSEKWEIRLQIVRALPLLSWTARERRRVIEILRRDLEHPQKFVRAWALDSLATFAVEDRRLVPDVLRSLDAFERSRSKALSARARQIRARLGRVRPGFAPSQM
jgi:hypothetical protein